MEGKKPERHPYSAKLEEFGVLKKQKDKLVSSLKSLKDEFGRKSDYEQGGEFNKIMAEVENINNQIHEIELKIEKIILEMGPLEEKMGKEN